jgi:RHS repeat-associated protein
VLVETVKYYTLGGRRIAMRKVPAEPSNPPSTLYYLFSDHLGSTSVSYNTTNSQTQTIRYYPYGEARTGTVPTDRRFTGQRWDGTIDLYDYNARWYDAALGRFIQPDTLIQTDAKDLIPYLPLAVSYANPKTLEQWNQRQRAHPQPGALASDPPLMFDPQLLRNYLKSRWRRRNHKRAQANLRKARKLSDFLS